MKKILFILFAFGLCTTVAQAQTWQGGAAGYWGDPANWSAVGTDYVFNGGTQTVTLSDSAASTPGGYTYNINNLELLNVTNVTFISAGAGADFKGTINISNRVRTQNNGVKSWIIGDAADPTKNNLAINSDKLTVGLNNSNNNVTVTQHGGDVRFTGNQGYNTSAPMLLGHWPNHTGQYVLNGGVLEVLNGYTMVGWDGTGRFTVNGGTATIWRMETRNTGHYTITGGSLILGSHTTQFKNSNSISLGGGTLGAYAAWTSTRPATLTGTNGDVTFDTTGGQITWTGVLSGVGGLEHDGTGTLLLTANNTYAGNTTITSGTIQVGNNGGSGQLGNGTGIITIASGATLDYRRTGTFTVANQITGAGNVVQNQTGTIILTGANDHTGMTIVNSGTIQVGNNGATGQLGTGDTQLAAGTQLDFRRTGVCEVLGRITGSGDVLLNGTGEVVFTADNDYTGTTTFAAGDLVIGNGGTTGTLGTSLVLAIPAGSTLAYNRSDDIVVAKAFSGAGDFEQRGTGTLTLTAANSYTGTTTITNGILQVGNGGTTGQLGTGAVTNNTKLVFNRSNNSIVANDITGTGSLEQAGAGQTTLIGTNSYSGTTLVSSGTLEVSSDIYSGQASGLFEVRDGAELSFGAAANMPMVGVDRTLAFDLGSTATITNLANLNTAAIDILELRGNYAYNQDFTNVANWNGKEVVLNGAAMQIQGNVRSTNLGEINSTSGSLEIVIYEANTQGNAALVAGNLVTTAACTDLTVTLDSSYQLADQKRFDVFSGIWANPNPSSLNTRLGSYLLDYRYQGGTLYGLMSYSPQQTDTIDDTTNPDATEKLLDPTTLKPSNTPTGQFQRKIQAMFDAGVSYQEIDALVQQFTQSMASASAAQVATVNQQMLQVVGSQLSIPWQNSLHNSNLIRAQNGARTLNEALGMTYQQRKAPAITGQPYARANTNAWFQSLGYTGSQEMKNNFAGYTTSGWGFALGMDKRFRNGVFGVAYGYTGNTLDSNAWQGTENPNKVDIQTHSLLLYGIGQVTEKTFLAGKIGFTHADNTGFRIPMSDYTAHWKVASQTFFAQATLGYELLRLMRLTVTPKLKLSYYNFEQNAYDETWSDGSVAQMQAWDNGYCEYDIIVDTMFSLTTSTSLFGSLGYRHVSGSEGAVLNTGFGGLNYEVLGVDPATHVFMCDLGADIMLTERLTLVAEYNLRSGNGRSSLHGGTGTLVWRF